MNDRLLEAMAGGDLEPAYWYVFELLASSPSQSEIRANAEMVKTLNAIAAYRQASQLPKKIEELLRQVSELETRIGGHIVASADDAASQGSDRQGEPPPWRRN